ncbi:MAG: hypothetical protein M1840_003035 [Geoglossum simile]|nr:MAG: hypothetical protein M1840_003035 [Geoglossum simile]
MSSQANGTNSPEVHIHPELEVVPSIPPEVPLPTGPEVVSPVDSEIVHPPAPEDSPRPSGKNIFGLRPTTFWLSLTLIVVIGAFAIFGGVKGSRHHPIPITSTAMPPITTPAATFSTGPTSATLLSKTTTVLPTMSLLPLDCPSIAGKIYQTRTGYFFQVSCGVDWPIDGPAADGNGTVTDIAPVIVHSLNDCIEACAGYNYASNRSNDNRLCEAVTWNSFTAVIDSRYGNCFLKDKVGKDVTGPGFDLTVASAKLVKSFNTLVPPNVTIQASVS